MKPFQIFGFFLLLFLSLGVISLVYPDEGIAITDEYRLDYPSLSELFAIDTVAQKDFSEIIANDFDIDSLELEENRIKDSVRQVLIRDSIRNWQLKLHYPGDDKSILYPFFKKLENKSKSNQIRIMHYGDSQIEGDRITGYLRYKLQGKFGGSGPGLLPAAPLVKTASIDYSASENWNRYTLYGLKDTTVNHSNYGPMATFGRFTPLERDSILLDSLMVPDTTVHEAWLRYSRSPNSYRITRDFSRVSVWFGNQTDSVKIRLMANDTIEINEKKFPPSEYASNYQYNLNFNPESVSIQFSGKDSPDVYAINLDNTRGIIVDNIAMRGSSGTIFRRMGHNILSKFFNSTPVELLILQFGGNVMPYIKSESECDRYGRWFESQIKYLKELNPNASIVVIGPSDMGTFMDGKYTSYTLLPNVRDALKTATFNQGGVYWDMMEAMGGSDSMKAWVEANPPLASSDYVHFNHSGASKIAQMFYNALIQDYNEYKDTGL